MNQRAACKSDILRKFISCRQRWVFDKAGLQRQVDQWFQILPWIQPYYAMKSNPSPQILRTLSEHPGVGMDAASLQEVALASKYASKDKTLFTNTHTMPRESDKMRACLQDCVDIKVVDSLCEVQKLVQYDIMPAKVLVRTKSNITAAHVKLDSKFGATQQEALDIAEFCREHALPICGVSFHIGSGGEFPRREAYKTALSYAEPVLDHIRTFLQEDALPVLDIGGGLLYDTDLEEALGFTRGLPYRIIAEPGRYFSEPAFHLFTQVIAKTDRGLFLDNGVYHELNVFHRDHWTFPAITHTFCNNVCEEIAADQYASVEVFGPTCDSYDTIGPTVLPVGVEVGDWILLDNMGAYTMAGKVDFNGIPSASSRTCLLTDV